ncbi:MAG: hypothetical protein F6K00_20600 [Leptolyngbya sp. SIOISBB]|nr:hypothetical protein [Leptolyngbya sp. SIOISBB]
MPASTAQQSLRSAFSLLVLLGLVACQAATTEVEEEALVEDETVAAQVFPDDFAQVCNEIGFAPAQAYESTPGEVHPIYVFERANETEAYSKSYRDLPEGWEKDWEASQETQLVACLTLTQETLSNTCEFPPEEGETDVYVLETYDTAYDVAIYHAKSGEQLDSTTFELQADDECPMFHMFTEGELADKSNPDYSQVLLEFVKPYVQPEA